MQRLLWVDAGAPAPKPSRLYRPSGIGHYLFQGPIESVAGHWLVSHEQTVAHQLDKCPHCMTGLPIRLEGFAPAARWNPSTSRRSSHWFPLVLWLAPSLIDRVVSLGRFIGEIVTIEVDQVPSSRYRRYRTKFDDAREKPATPLQILDVRATVEAAWGYGPSMTAPAVEPPDDVEPDVLPFQVKAG